MTAGENIAFLGTSGSMDIISTAQTMYAGWFNSPGHYENMMNSSFSSVAISCCFTVEERDGLLYLTVYGVQLFLGQ